MWLVVQLNSWRRSLAKAIPKKLQKDDGHIKAPPAGASGCEREVTTHGKFDGDPEDGSEKPPSGWGHFSAALANLRVT